MSSPRAVAALFLASESDGGVEAQDDDDDDDDDDVKLDVMNLRAARGEFAERETRERMRTRREAHTFLRFEDSSEMERARRDS